MLIALFLISLLLLILLLIAFLSIILHLIYIALVFINNTIIMHMQSLLKSRPLHSHYTNRPFVAQFREAILEKKTENL